MSIFQLTYGMVDSFVLFMVLKTVSQAFSAAVSPLTFSIIADNFGPENRTTANAMLTSAKMVGMAMASISVLMIKQIGWRSSYIVIGSFGLIATTLALIFLKNPKREQVK